MLQTFCSIPPFFTRLALSLYRWFPLISSLSHFQSTPFCPCLHPDSFMFSLSLIYFFPFLHQFSPFWLFVPLFLFFPLPKRLAAVAFSHALFTTIMFSSLFHSACLVSVYVILFSFHCPSVAYFSSCAVPCFFVFLTR